GAAAGALGTVNKITFEGETYNLPGVDGSPLILAPGVTLTTLGTDHPPLAGLRYNYGTSNGPGQLNPINNGFNITQGRSNFFEFVPIAPASGVGTASVSFQFQTPISAFGLFLTGLGNIPGNSLSALFNDGTSRRLSIVGSSGGGVQFWGFTDPGARIS